MDDVVDGSAWRLVAASMDLASRLDLPQRGLGRPAACGGTLVRGCKISAGVPTAAYFFTARLRAVPAAMRSGRRGFQ